MPARFLSLGVAVVATFATAGLTYVDLQDSKVTDKGAEGLRKSKPEITILGPATAVKTFASDHVEPGR